MKGLWDTTYCFSWSSVRFSFLSWVNVILNALHTICNRTLFFRFWVEPVVFPDYTYEIGQVAKMRCKVNRMRMWDSITINGTKDIPELDKPFHFMLLSNNETCLNTNDSRITSEVTIKQTRSPSAKYDDIEVLIHFSEIECQDMGSYECWIDGPTIYKVTNALTVKRKSYSYF